MHRALDDDGPVPFAFWLGQFCEAFHCLPAAAYRAWLDAPAGLLEEMLDARAYAEAKRVYDAATNKQDIPRTPLFTLMRTIAMDLAREEIARRQAAEGSSNG